MNGRADELIHFAKAKLLSPEELAITIAAIPVSRLSSRLLAAMACTSAAV
jgi:hypothetical protein